jgi:hypothetical protein
MGVVGVGGYIFWALDGGLVREGNWVGVDFHVYYQAAQVLARGEDIYAAGISPPYVYPPLLAALVVPLTALSWNDATIAWKLLQHVWLLIAGGLLVNLMPVRIRPLAAGLLLLGCLTVPLQDEIRVGESNSLVLALIAGAVWLVAWAGDGRRETLAYAIAGVLLAFAAGIKVLPVLLVAYFWWRGPRTVAAAATGVFLLLQMLLFALTPSTADYWFVQFPGLFGQAFPFLDNQSINAFLSRALLPNSNPVDPTTQIASGEALRPALTWALNLIVVAAGAFVLWRTGTRPRPQNGPVYRVRLLLEVGLALLTTHLVSGSTWLHHLVMLSVPLLGLLGAWWLGEDLAAGDAPRARRTVIYALAAGASLAVLLHRPEEWLLAINSVAPARPFLALLAGSAAMWVVAGMWLAVAVVLLRASWSRASFTGARVHNLDDLA